MRNSEAQEIEYISEFGKFLEELWEKRNPKPRINVMRMKQKQALNEKENHQEDDEEKRKDRSQETFEKLKRRLEVADEDEELFNQQYNNIKVLIEKLDKRALEEFWICLDHNRAEVKRKRFKRLKEEENSQEADKIAEEMK